MSDLHDMPARVSQITAGATRDHNEDHVAIIESGAITDLIVLDGATSVADRNYIDDGGDVVWFVRRFTAALEPAIRAGLEQADAVQRALDTVREEFLACAEGATIPVYAWPIAALTWIRATPDGTLHLYCVGDCITLMRQPDGKVIDLDPFVNPQEAVLQAEIARLRTAGIVDPAERHAHLLPMLRARREDQNRMANPSILCLQPNGALHARRHVVSSPAGAVLLGMTDGFYRLVDPYHLLGPAALMGLCVERGLEAALAMLRDHEARMSAGLSVKRADDASAVLWRAE